MPDPSTVTSHEVLIDAVAAQTGDANLLMQPSLKETGLRTSAGVLVRWPDNVNGLTHYTFFTPDSGTAPSYGLGTAGSSTANVASTWVVKARDAGGALADPGVVAGGNIIIEAAGKAVKRPLHLISAVSVQPGGTWLPLKLRRDGESIEMVVRFPVER